MYNYTSKTVVFFGDSVTEGCFGLYPTDYGFDTYREPDECYVTKAETILCNKYGSSINIINSGKSGDSSKSGLARIKDSVLSYNPDVVVVAFGLNDSFKEIGAFYKSYSEILKSICDINAIPVLMTPNMMNTYIHPKTLPCAMKVASRTVELQNGGALDAISDIIRSEVIRYGGVLCDVYSVWKSLFKSGRDTTELLSNYINHPTKEMHTLIAPSVASCVEKALMMG